MVRRNVHTLMAGFALMVLGSVLAGCETTNPRAGPPDAATVETGSPKLTADTTVSAQTTAGAVLTARAQAASTATPAPGFDQGLAELKQSVDAALTAYDARRMTLGQANEGLIAACRDEVDLLATLTPTEWVRQWKALYPQLAPQVASDEGGVFGRLAEDVRAATGERPLCLDTSPSGNQVHVYLARAQQDVAQLRTYIDHLWWFYHAAPVTDPIARQWLLRCANDEGSVSATLASWFEARDNCLRALATGDPTLVSLVVGTLRIGPALPCEIQIDSAINSQSAAPQYRVAPHPACLLWCGWILADPPSGEPELTNPTRACQAYRRLAP